MENSEIDELIQYQEICSEQSNKKKNSYPACEYPSPRARDYPSSRFGSPNSILIIEEFAYMKNDLIESNMADINV